VPAPICERLWPGACLLLWCPWGHCPLLRLGHQPELSQPQPLLRQAYCCQHLHWWASRLLLAGCVLPLCWMLRQLACQELLLLLLLLTLLLLLLL
jgi:hypothetical protein